MRVAQCPWLAQEPRVAGRIADCLVTAIRGALAPLNDPQSPLRVLPPALFVNLPSSRTGLPPNLAASIGTALSKAFANTFTRVEIIEKGHAGGLMALQAAAQALGSNRSEACIVAGADSYMDPDTLEWLEATDQLHSAGPRNNAWGFIPGEGAGAILVITPVMARRTKVPAHGRITGLGVAREANIIRSGAVCVGAGLTSAFRDALAGLPRGALLTDVYCDMNGEPYRADEYGFAVARTRERFVSATDFVAAADSWGDVGAASSLLGLILACVAGAKSYANGPHALVWASSDAGDRAAVLVDTADISR